jgi:hypothetical protein
MVCLTVAFPLSDLENNLVAGKLRFLRASPDVNITAKLETLGDMRHLQSLDVLGSVVAIVVVLLAMYKFAKEEMMDADDPNDTQAQSAGIC